MVNTVAPNLPAETNAGAFVRQPYSIRDRVTADGSSGFRAEPGRLSWPISRSGRVQAARR
jgi:glutathionyl-hydroquinone reductase